MSEDTIIFERKDSIGVLTLNRPETVNALNQKMIEELEALFGELVRERINLGGTEWPKVEGLGNLIERATENPDPNIAFWVADFRSNSLLPWARQQ